MTRETLDLKEMLDHSDLKDLQDKLVHKDRRDLAVLPEIEAKMDQLAPMELQVF